MLSGIETKISNNVANSFSIIVFSYSTNIRKKIDIKKLFGNYLRLFNTVLFRPLIPKANPDT